MAREFTVDSRSFKPGEVVPEDFLYDGFGCQGKNLSPEVRWKNAPPETKSFAVTLFDPDAPTNHGWWHWAVVNIPQNVNLLPEGASHNYELPKGAQELLTDFREKGYGGPCPPKGDKPHRYVLTVYALRQSKLEVHSDTTAEMLRERLERISLARASLEVKYGH